MRERKFFGGGAGGRMLVDFYSISLKVTENANNDKTIDFFPTSSVMLLSGLKIHHH